LQFQQVPATPIELFETAAIRLTATEMGITKITATNTNITLVFDKEPNINVDALLKLVQLKPKDYQLKNQTRLICTADLTKVVQKIELIWKVLALLKKTGVN